MVEAWEPKGKEEGTENHQRRLEAVAMEPCGLKLSLEVGRVTLGAGGILYYGMPFRLDTLYLAFLPPLISSVHGLTRRYWRKSVFCRHRGRTTELFHVYSFEYGAVQYRAGAIPVYRLLRNGGRFHKLHPVGIVDDLDVLIVEETGI